MIQEIRDVFTKEIQHIICSEPYLNKISKKAKVLVAYDGERLGFIVFYCNDSISQVGYVTLFGVRSDRQNQHVGKSLLRHCEEICVRCGMRYLDLEVSKDNENGLRFYRKHDFSIKEERADTYIMRKSLKE